ncbi:hypothetical protein C8R31_10497 [Nitrosospira sp. Nsp2]|uniref:hypothetical protein n=1 Tax=Nitrosospira sp. Nsp2 TaxID=136548 RepID=UPI000D327BB8|nr:hypothetical protein [Nitrosospira sp. Nsp2]PTR15070.1 hypothetical protein C8R31_10497 [Nitrosospira sp. Nsp2]
MSEKPALHWLKRVARAVAWIIVAGLPVVTAIFIAGPDAIRNFPKVPGAISETVKSVLYQSWLDKQLTGKWSDNAHGNAGPPPPNSLTIELWVNDGTVDGLISSSYVGKWKPSDLPVGIPAYYTALLRGEIEGNSLKVEVYDFVDAKIVKFADIAIWYGEEDLGDFGASTPDDNIQQLRVETKWQLSPALPESLTLTRAH